MDELTQHRLARNEAVFREVNEHVAAVEERFDNDDAGFVCECADASCSDTIQLPLDTYQRVRAKENRFVLVPGHERPEIETVVERHEEYLFVEKFVPATLVS